MKSKIILGAMAASISFGACASLKDGALCDDAAYAKAEKILDASALGKEARMLDRTLREFMLDKDVDEQYVLSIAKASFEKREALLRQAGSCRLRYGGKLIAEGAAFAKYDARRLMKERNVEDPQIKPYLAKIPEEQCSAEELKRLNSDIVVSRAANATLNSWKKAMHSFNGGETSAEELAKSAPGLQLLWDDFDDALREKSSPSCLNENLWKMKLVGIMDETPESDSAPVCKAGDPQYNGSETEKNAQKP